MVRFTVEVTNSEVSETPRAITLQAAQETVDQWIKTIGVRYFDEMTNLAPTRRGSW